MTNSYQHWRVERDINNIVWLYFDKAAATTNTLSKAVLLELAQLIQSVAENLPYGLVILSAKQNGFIAGADIEEFTQITEVSEATEFVALGRRVFDHLAKLDLPTDCAIHGFCLGGGLELALACHYRIATDEPSTKLGLPEVMLGIYPGWGGVTRLPRLIGAPAALDLMLTGKIVDAKRAKKLGMIDHVVPLRQLKNAAYQLIQAQPPHHQASFLQRLTYLPLARPFIAERAKKSVAKRVSQAHYPAPYAIIDLWQKYDGNPLRMPADAPGSLASLLNGSTAKNLIRVFFLQEQLKSLGKENSFKAQQVHVIGAGVMGGDIAAWCALRGLRVTLQDRAPAQIAPAIKRAHELFKIKLKEPRLIQAAMDRLIPDPAGNGVRQADVVIEAIFENLEAKQALYRELEPKLKSEAVLATNTSSLPLEQLSQGLTDPGRLVGLHFFNPVARMQLIEIVVGTQSSPAMVSKAVAFARQIDRLPLPVKSVPGFLVNRILMPYLLEAMTLVGEGVAPTEIDQVAVKFGMPMGPLELADTIGLDVCLSAGRIFAEERHLQPPVVLLKLTQAGHLGRKTGQGFYRYQQGKMIKPAKASGSIPVVPVQDRLILAMLNEAVACLAEKIVENDDRLDAGVIFATGFAPFTGGPIHYIQQHRDKLCDNLKQLHGQYGERFKPHFGWNTIK